MQNRDQATKRLFDAIVKNDISSVKSAIFDGADVNGTVKDINGPPLFKAAYKGNLAIINLLLERNADIHGSITNGSHNKFNGSGVIESAVEGKHPEVISFLIERGANPNQVRRDGGTALLSAAYHRNSAIVKILLESGANIDQFYTSKDSALSIAAENNNVDTVKVLVAHILEKFKNKPDELVMFLKSNDQFKTAITKAQDHKVLSELMNLIDALLESGIDHADIRTLLPTEYIFKNAYVKENLLARIQTLPANQRIALCSIILTEPNHPYRVIFSIQRGKNPCQLGHGVLLKVKNTMDAAIKQRNEVNKASGYYNHTTPLYYAAGNNDLALARKLIHDGADCTKEVSTKNPLFAAATTGNIDMINLLVDNGANPNMACKTTKQDLWKQFETQKGFLKDALTNFLLRFPTKEVTITPTDYAAIFGYADAADLLTALSDQPVALAVAQAEALPEAQPEVKTEVVAVAPASDEQKQEEQDLATAIQASLATEQPTEQPVEVGSVVNSNNSPYAEATAIMHSDASLYPPVELRAAEHQVIVQEEKPPVMQAPIAVESEIPPAQLISIQPVAVTPAVDVLELLFTDAQPAPVSQDILQPTPVVIKPSTPVVTKEIAVGELISFSRAAPAASDDTETKMSASTRELLSLSLFAPAAPTPVIEQPAVVTPPQPANDASEAFFERLDQLKVPTQPPVKAKSDAQAEKKPKQLVLG